MAQDRGLRDLGLRLRAYRLGRGLTAENVASRLGISRAAVYRLEKGEVVKIETLVRLAALLDTEIGSLLGASVEYHVHAPAFFERMRQVEEESQRVVAYFEPFSYLLMSPSYTDVLQAALLEGLARTEETGGEAAAAEVGRVIAILRERQAAAGRHHPTVVSLVSSRALERFLRMGIAGRFDLPAPVAHERRVAARREVERLVGLLEEEPMGVQIGIVDDALPSQPFQIFEARSGTTVAISPFRLGEQPNVRYGVAMVTRAPEAVRHFRDLADRIWARSLRGERGAALIRALLARTTDVVPNLGLVSESR